MANYDLSYTGANVNSTLAAVGGKADKVSSATNGHFAGLDSNGNLTDSGKAASDFATASSVTTIEGKIPTQASSSNQLADKDFVNSSISTATATFKGTYNLVSDLSLTTSATTSDIASALATAVTGEDNNDYAFVQIPTADATPTEISHIDRYKFNGTAWGYEFSLNNSSFTAAQWAAINSGITSTIVSSISGKYVKPSGGIPKTDLESSVQTSLGKADSALQSETSLSLGTTSGNGNAVTDISVSGHQITMTKGSTFLTSQTKANWNETSSSSDAYIQNKPTNLVSGVVSGTNTALSISVVSALPASPDSNTIYIVVSA